MKIKNTAPGGRGFYGIEIPAGATVDIDAKVVEMAQKCPGAGAWFEDGTLVIVDSKEVAKAKDAAK